MELSEFESLAARTRLSERGKAGARAVLVDQRSQVDVAREYGVRQPTVSVWCRSVLERRRKHNPTGWESCTVVVPSWLALEIRKMAHKAYRERERRPVGRPRKKRKPVPVPAIAPPNVADAAAAARSLLRLIPSGSAE